VAVHSDLPFAFRKSIAFPAISIRCLLSVKVASASYVYAISYSSTLTRNRLLDLMIRLNSCQGCVGVVRSRFKLSISDRRIMIEERLCTPPLSRVEIRGVEGD
jgi:hypothetical protein